MKLKLNNLMRWGFFVLALLMCNLAIAQRTITGVVTDGENGEPLIGANILVVGTSTGTITDFDGNYSLNVSADAKELEFSYTGYTSQRIAIDNQTEINVELSAGELLDEVVVIGYGTVKKEDATGAVEQLTKKDFNKGVITSPEQMIQGRAAGVQITPASGEPGAGANIRIRGTSSIRAGNNPLIVLDGVPLDGRDVSAGADVGAGRSSARNPLNFINPNDIASINVLKDASATAIYGSRGANGVIIIETKKGSRERPELSFSATGTMSMMPSDREYDLLTGDQFREANGNANLDFGGNVDAFDEIMRTAYTQNYNLAYGGSSENGRYRFSLGAQNQEGIINETNLKKYTGTMNITQKFWNDRLSINGLLIGSFVEDQAAPLAGTVGAEGDLMISALRWNPTRPFVDDKGELVQPSDNERNPVAFLDYFDDFTETSRIFGNISATLTLTKGLDYKYNFGIDRSESSRRIAISRAFNANFAANSGLANIESIQQSTQVHEHTLSYNNNLGASTSLNAVVGYSYQSFQRKGNNMRGANFLVDDQGLYVNNLNYAGSFPSEHNGSFFDPDDELQSFFGRAVLGLADRFLVTATVRADGSSRFGEGNRYGVFPSAAVAWQLHKEDFIPDAFNNLKLRLSWGITGNQEFPSGSAQTQFKPLDNGAGITQNNVGNPDLKWEETTQYNAGVDFAFFDYRLSGSIDWYTKETKDLLFRVRVAQQAPDVFVWRNFEDITVENTGVDFNVDVLMVDKDNFQWDAGVNFSIYQNTVNNVTAVFPNGIITGEINGQGLSNQRAQLIYDNQPLYSFYLAEFTGFDSEGLATYADLNNDGENTASGIVGPGDGDRAFAGDPNPDFTIGLRTGVTIGNFDASLYGYGNFGHQVFDNTALALFNRAALNGGANVDARVLDSGQGGGDSPLPSTLFLEDADFFRIANLTLGYNFSIGESTWIRSARVFLTGQNLFVFTQYNGFDPEVNIDKAIDEVPSFGIDYSSYPRARSFSLGVNLNF